MAALEPMEPARLAALAFAWLNSSSVDSTPLPMVAPEPVLMCRPARSCRLCCSASSSSSTVVVVLTDLVDLAEVVRITLPARVALCRRVVAPEVCM